MRVTAIIQMRNQRGARQRFIRRISRRSRRSIYPQRLRATAIALPHPDGRKQRWARKMHKWARKISRMQIACACKALLLACSDGLGDLLTRTSTCPVGLEVRIHSPKHPFALPAAFDSRGPFSAKTDFVHPVPNGKSGYQHRERRQRQRPWLVIEE